MVETEIFHTGLFPAALSYAVGVAAVLLVIVLLVIEIRRIRGPLKYLLFLTRLILVAVVTLYLAQPNLLRTTRHVHSGNVLVVRDDSTSMFVRDRYADARTALDLATMLGLKEAEGRSLALAQLADQLQEHVDGLRELHQHVADAVRTVEQGLPWSDQSVAAVAQAADRLKAAHRFLAAGTSGSLRATPGAESLSRRIDEIVAVIDPQKETGLSGLIGKPDLLQRDWQILSGELGKLVDRTDALRQRLQELQEAGDQAFLGSAGRREAIRAALSDLSRYDLAGRVIANTAALKNASKLNLSAGEATVAAATAAKKTSLVGPVHDVLADRPLELINAVYLLSDGGQNVNYDLEHLEIFRKRGVPLVVVGVGAASATTPLALSDYRYPLVVGKRDPIPVTLDLKLDLPAGTPMKLVYSLDGDAEAPGPDAGKAGGGESVPPRAARASKAHTLPYEEVVASDGRPVQRHEVTLAIAEAGFHEIRVKLVAETPPVEITRSLPIYVAPRDPAVLLVAEQPDVLSQAILAQRGLGVKVYPVFTFGKEANAKRGKSRSRLPDQPEDWARYDLVILKGRPFPGFAQTDAKAILEAVRGGQLALWLVLDGADSYYSAFGRELGWLSEKRPSPVPNSRMTPNEAAHHLPAVRLSSEITRSLNQWERFSAPQQLFPVPRLDFPLLDGPDGWPVAALGFHGGGKLLATGLAGLRPMNEWHSPELDLVVNHFMMDLLTPTALWQKDGAGIGTYPLTGTIGKDSVVIAKSVEPNPEAALRVRDEKGEVKELGGAARGNWILAKHKFPRAGSYTVSWGDLKKTYRVAPEESAETRDIGIDDGFLNQVAAAAGGVYAPLVKLGSVAAEVPAKTRESTDQRVIRIADYYLLVLIAAIVLAALDFVLRKHCGLTL